MSTQHPCPQAVLPAWPGMTLPSPLPEQPPAAHRAMPSPNLHCPASPYAHNSTQQRPMSPHPAHALHAAAHAAHAAYTLHLHGVHVSAPGTLAPPPHGHPPWPPTFSSPPPPHRPPPPFCAPHVLSYGGMAPPFGSPPLPRMPAMPAGTMMAMSQTRQLPVPRDASASAFDPNAASSCSEDGRIYLRVADCPPLFCGQSPVSTSRSDSPTQEVNSVAATGPAGHGHSAPSNAQISTAGGAAPVGGIEIYVGNLSPRVSEAMLLELLVLAGAAELSMPRNAADGSHRGFAFGRFSCMRVAQYAIALLDGMRLDGLPLRVRHAHAPTQHWRDFRSV